MKRRFFSARGPKPIICDCVEQPIQSDSVKRSCHLRCWYVSRCMRSARPAALTSLTLAPLLAVFDELKVEFPRGCSPPARGHGTNEPRGTPETLSHSFLWRCFLRRHNSNNVISASIEVVLDITRSSGDVRKLCSSLSLLCHTDFFRHSFATYCDQKSWSCTLIIDQMPSKSPLVAHILTVTRRDSWHMDETLPTRDRPGWIRGPSSGTTSSSSTSHS